MITDSFLAPTDEVELISKGVGKWKVLLKLPIEEVKGKNELYQKINHLKKQIAESLELPPQLLEFGDVANKKTIGDKLEVTLEISKKTLENGPLAVHILPGISDYGMKFNDMEATLDLYVFDTMGSLVSEDKIKKLIAKNQISPDFVQWDTIRKSLEKLMEDHQPIIGLTIAKGISPDPGRDAELNIPSLAGMTEDEIGRCVDERVVRRNDILVNKTPPRRGSKEGKSVKGESIPAPIGRDIMIQAERGTIINLKETEVAAQIEGLMNVEFINPDSVTEKFDLDPKHYKQKIIVKINPLRTLTNSKPIDVCTNSSVEIRGHLKKDSKVISSSEIIVKGDVENDTVLESKDDIHIHGSTKGGTIVSQKNVFITSNVNNTEITAKNNVRIDNIAKDSKIAGCAVEIKGLCGGEIVAKEKVTLGKIVAGNDGKKPVIKVGMEDYHQNRVQENRKFIEFSAVNLGDMKNIFGDEIVDKVNRVNMKAMFLKHVKEVRLTSKITYRKDQAEAIMQLLDSTSSIRELSDEKIEENNKLSKKIEEALGALKQVEIVRGSTTPIHLKLGSKTKEIGVQDRSVRLSQINNEEIKEEALDLAANGQDN
jgi:uncharacterized protein (DUF342 family)